MVASGDRDPFQLASPSTMILYPARAGEIAREHGPAEGHACLGKLVQGKRFIAPLRHIKWIVYCKAPFAGPKQVLRYLSRYTHRVAISNRRLVAADDAAVAFRWKDTRIEGPGRWKTMRLHPHEFIRRFLLHVLPRGFHRIRHMWTASWQAVFDGLIALVGCGHMSGLLVRYRTAGPDDIRQSWSLSLRRARGSWRMSGCPGLSLRPCRSSRRCACQSLRN